MQGHAFAVFGQLAVRVFEIALQIDGAAQQRLDSRKQPLGFGQSEAFGHGQMPDTWTDMVRLRGPSNSARKILNDEAGAAAGAAAAAADPL